MNANQQPSQAERILARLQAARQFDGWVPMPVLADASGAYAVHSRVAELRNRGHRIQNKVTRQQDGKRLSWYRLAVEEVAA